MAEIVNLADRRPPPNPGNGAREALIELFTETNVNDPATFADDLLAEVWLRGFKIVPLDGTEK